MIRKALIESIPDEYHQSMQYVHMTSRINKILGSSYTIADIADMDFEMVSAIFNYQEYRQ